MRGRKPLTPLHEQNSNSHLVVIGTDFTDNCKSNYHTIMTSTTSHYGNDNNNNTNNNNKFFIYRGLHSDLDFLIL
jgi:hypothetical protein